MVVYLAHLFASSATSRLNFLELFWRASSRDEVCMRTYVLHCKLIECLIGHFCPSQVLFPLQNVERYFSLCRTREWSDESDSNYRYWQQGQPDNVGEKQECVATNLGNGGLWSDEDCNRELRFICYRDSGEWVYHRLC